MIKIGIPVLNRGDLLAGLVQSIDVPANVLVIVNRIGPVDESVEHAVTKLLKGPPTNVSVDVLWTDGNLGVSGSWNKIMDHFAGNCFIANSDIRFTPGVLAKATDQISSRSSIVLQHLFAAACFYVTDRFVRQVGWFDENFYPAYHEDQEIALRCGALNVERCLFPGIDEDHIHHTGSGTLKSASENKRRFIQEAQKLNGKYLAARWGRLPECGSSSPEKRTPFGNPDAHPSDWELDIHMRTRIASLCEEITGFPCPIVFHRSKGGRI